MREQFKVWFHDGDKKAKLSVAEEAWSGIIGGKHKPMPLSAVSRTVGGKAEHELCFSSTAGTLACWNHPFEVARIEMQAAANAGEKSRSMMEVFRMVVKTDGVKGLFQGIIPRIGLGIWQTLFMVTGAWLTSRS